MYFTNSCIFAEFPLDPCDEIRGDKGELIKLLNAESTRFIGYSDGMALMQDNDGHSPVYLSCHHSSGEKIFLGKDKNHAYFAIEINNKKTEGKLIDLRSIARAAVKNGFSTVPSLLARGKMLLDWHARHQYCAKCGNQSDSDKGGYVRKCTSCNAEHFPRVDPVVIMMITQGDKCLLGRSAHFVTGMYSALAGFMEPGETIEEAVRREVWEEANIKVGKVDYIKSQPWPFPSSLMIGVIGEALTTDIDIENEELEDAQWFSKEQIAAVISSGGDKQFRVPEKLAIARHLLDHWLKE